MHCVSIEVILTMIVTDLNYCQRCRKPNNNQYAHRTNYCTKCANSIGRNNYNRYLNSKIFIEHSFSDCIDELSWKGFNKHAKYKKSIIKQIKNKFPEIIYLKSSNSLKSFKCFINQPFLYLASDNKKELLKVGQTVNPYNRFAHYHKISINKPIYFDLFVTNNYLLQDLYENKLRNYLEFLGYILPADNTNNRLKYIIK